MLKKFSQSDVSETDLRESGDVDVFIICPITKCMHKSKENNMLTDVKLLAPLEKGEWRSRQIYSVVGFISPINCGGAKI